MSRMASRSWLSVGCDHTLCVVFFFFFQAEDGIRDLTVTGVQTCALPICGVPDGEQLLRIGAGPALAAHLLRDRQLDREAPIGGPAMSGPPAFDHGLGCVQDVHVSSSCFL